jgi:hypothetical protein
MQNSVQPAIPASIGIPKLKLPKIPGVPKLIHVDINKVGNGFNVKHSFHAHPPKQFVFHKASKMLAHIKRIQNSDWLHPNVDRDAKRITGVLNL